MQAADVSDNDKAEAEKEFEKLYSSNGGNLRAAQSPFEKLMEAVDWSDANKVARLQRLYKFGGGHFLSFGHDKDTDSPKFQYEYDVFDPGYKKYELSEEELSCQHML